MEKPEKPRITIRPDEAGNHLEIHNDPKFIHVYLCLKAERSKRLLGTVNKENRTMYLKRARGKHLFLKTKSYGFNHYLLANSKTFDFVYLEDEYFHWRIPKEYLLEKGKFLNFKERGFERQIFVPLLDLRKYAVKERVF